MTNEWHWHCHIKIVFFYIYFYENTWWIFSFQHCRCSNIRNSLRTMIRPSHPTKLQHKAPKTYYMLYFLTPFFTTRAPVVLIITSIKWHLWIDLYTIWEIWPSLWQSAGLHFPINPNGGIGRKKNLSKGRRTKPMQRDWQNSLSISSCFLLFPTLLP